MDNWTLGFVACVVSIITIVWLFRKPTKGGKKTMQKQYTPGGKINEQYLAEVVAQKEGLKKQVDIAQIKEVIKCTLNTLAQEFPDEAVLLLLNHHRK